MTKKELINSLVSQVIEGSKFFGWEFDSKALKSWAEDALDFFKEISNTSLNSLPNFKEAIENGQIEVDRDEKPDGSEWCQVYFWDGLWHCLVDEWEMK